MIVQNPQTAVLTEQKSHSGAVLKWVKNDRMGGFVPCWEKPTSARGTIEQNLSYALHDSAEGASGLALSYRPPPPAPRAQAFGFGDLIDIINPLQHLPIIGHLYRDLTGDQIRPAGRIIGGAVFGGFVGAGAGLVNVIAENETGKDVTGNALGLMGGAKSLSKKTGSSYTIAAYNALQSRYNE